MTFDQSELVRGLSDYTLPATAMEYLDKMRELCRENGSELILVKAPTNSWRYWWYDEWNEQIEEYAEKNGVAYYNFIPECENIGIDWTTDTYDEGAHLNVYGAEKMTRYFGEILKSSHGFSTPYESAEWNELVKTYYDRKKQMEEQK